MSVPARAWAVTAAGTAVNLCLGILYGWSVWKAALVPKDPALYGKPMTGLNEGWTYLDNFEGTVAYSLCGITFALFMIPGGRLQDRYGAKIGATLGGLFLAAGCIVAGLMKSYEGLIIGFGLLGGIGMGLGYAAATPAAVKWFHSSRRGLIVGLVVAGYGAAAVYISPLADYLISHYGLTGSFVGLGILFAVVVVIAGQLLNPPPAGYIPLRHLSRRVKKLGGSDASALAKRQTNDFTFRPSKCLAPGSSTRWCSSSMGRRSRG